MAKPLAFGHLDRAGERAATVPTLALEASAELAEADYRGNKDLTDFEAFAEELGARFPFFRVS